MKYAIYRYSDENGWEFTGIFRQSLQQALLWIDKEESEIAGPFKAVKL